MALVYLEDFLELVEELPNDFKHNFAQLRSLDLRVQSASLGRERERMGVVKGEIEGEREREGEGEAKEDRERRKQQSTVASEAVVLLFRSSSRSLPRSRWKQRRRQQRCFFEIARAPPSASLCPQQSVGPAASPSPSPSPLVLAWFNGDDRVASLQRP